MLAEATHPQLNAVMPAAKEALASHQAGFHRGAQSLSAAVVSEVVEGHLGFDRFSNARQSSAGYDWPN